MRVGKEDKLKGYEIVGWRLAVGLGRLGTSVRWWMAALGMEA